MKAPKVTNDQFKALLNIALLRPGSVMPLMLANTLLEMGGVSSKDAQGMPTFRWGDRVAPLEAKEGITPLQISPNADGVESWYVAALIGKTIVGEMFEPKTPPETEQDLDLAIEHALKFIEARL